MAQTNVPSHKNDADQKSENKCDPGYADDRLKSGINMPFDIHRYSQETFWGAIVIGLILLFGGLSLSGMRPWWAGCITAILVADLGIFILFAHYDPKPAIDPVPATKPAIAPATLPAGLHATFKQLRNSFESLALQSKGLRHILTERQQGAGIPQPTPDNIMPPGLSMKPNHPNTVLAFSSPPGDPIRPVALTEQEILAAPPEKDGDWLIRDLRKRALARWKPGITRMGYTYGDFAVLQQFHSLANAAGNALRGIPADIIPTLPPSIQPLCRVRETMGCTYKFGEVPAEDLPWMQGGWNPIAIPFENGVTVQNIEPASGENNPEASWLLLLHRLGWDSPPGSPFRATKRYWSGSTSLAISFPDQCHEFPNLDEIPRHRTYSVLGSEENNAADVCWASAWAIDRLLSLMVPS